MSLRKWMTGTRKRMGKAFFQAPPEEQLKPQEGAYIKVNLTQGWAEHKARLEEMNQVMNLIRGQHMDQLAANYANHQAQGGQFGQYFAMGQQGTYTVVHDGNGAYFIDDGRTPESASYDFDKEQHG